MYAPAVFECQRQLNRWIAFPTECNVLVRTGKVEIGQGILTALAQIVAEELCVDLEQVRMDAASTSKGPDEGYTVGSLSVEQSGPVMRFLGATLRQRLIAWAGVELGMPAHELSVCRGKVLRLGVPTRLSYWAAQGALLTEQIDLTQPVSLADSRSYEIVGTNVRRLDLRTKFAGGSFIQDFAIPGMHHAKVLRKPSRDATLLSLDLAWLQVKHPGVQWVRNGDFVACVASTELEAMAAQHSLARSASWQDNVSDKNIEGEIETWLKMQTVVETVVEPRESEAQGASTFTGTWSRCFLAHGSIGLCTALAFFDEDHLDIWTHSQGIYFLREQVARVLNRSFESIDIHHVAGAGCYGHNGADDAAFEAALIALACPGTPVRLQWSREEELCHAPLGAAMATYIEAVLGVDKKIASWSTHVTSTTHGARPGMHGEPNLQAAGAVDARWRFPLAADTPESNGGGASRNARPIYDVGQLALKLSLVTTPVRTSALRALGAHVNVVAVEGMMDILATDAGMNPLEFRRLQLSDDRAIATLDKVVAMSGWAGCDVASNPDTHYGMGLARYKERGSYCAVVAEIELGAAIQVKRIWCAVDAGLIVNPDGAKNQIEGGIIQSISWTLHEAMKFEGGVPASKTWVDYPILRFQDVPEVHVELLNSTEPSVGVGETSVGPTAAAICNAASGALGIRLKTLPIDRDRLMTLLAGA